MTAVPPDVGELRRLEASTRPGDWFAHFTVHGDPSIVRDLSRPAFTRIAVVSTTPDDYGHNDAALIAALRNAASWLLEQAEAADRVRATIEQLCDTVFGDQAEGAWYVLGEMRRALEGEQ